MITTEWRMPDGPLRGSAAAAQTIGIVAVVLLAELAARVCPLGEAYALKATATFTAIVVLSFGFLQRHHPFARFGAANQMTTARATLVALVAGLVGEPRLPAVAAFGAAISLVVTSLDGVDGWLARRAGICSAFGARFDMEIDALLILVLSILAWQFGKAGVWVIASGLLRYAFIAAGAIWPWMAAALPPSRRRQSICVLQIAALIIAIAPAVVPPVSTVLASIALVALTCSFLTDGAWLWRRAR